MPLFYGVLSSCYFRGDPLNVTCSLHVSSFDSVEAARMEYSVTLYLKMKWRDPRLYHNGSDTIIVRTPEFVNRIWRPDVYFENGKSGNFHGVTSDNRAMSILYTGEIQYNVRLSLTLSCHMQLSGFPMDQHTCPMILLSYAYDARDIVLHWRKKLPVQLFQHNELSQFTLVDYRTFDEIMTKEDNVQWSVLEARFYLRRQMGYYVLTTYLPSTLLVILSWISFWLHLDSTAARVALGITTILTEATQISTARQGLPEVSYATAIDVWLATCMFFVFVAMLEFATVHYIHVNGKRIVVRKRHEQMESSTGTENATKRQKAEFKLHVDFENPKNNDDTRDVKKTMFKIGSRITAKKIDQISRVLFPILFTLFNIIYWSIYLERKPPAMLSPVTEY
ncbi:glycine receptor subunit alpha-3-like [Saccoglossus kowalevskii]|uniref:Glycine receptor subunit alpha-3-like n=1 Tax=Saccoglossus kowalevskii TaxID=10224 RepID=A0ABM0LYF6_SACKO|nr:PREDICTED: glycine receptor subunit alpha-3-like [Saccoglossus kowalevskii]